MMSPRKASLSMFVAALTVVACSPSSHVASNAAANRISIDLRPGDVEIHPGDAVKFQAIVTGTANASVEWSVQEVGGGAIDATGGYVGPQALGTYHVQAKSVADPTVSSVATVRVTAIPSVVISITPQTASVTTGGTVPFSAVVTGTSNTAVSWQVQEGPNGGAITQAGLYTAPAYSGVFHVVATSVASSAIKAQAVVTVDSGVRISATSPVGAVACEAVQLTATVTGSTDTGVVWSAPAACGTVTSAGVFTSLRVSGSCVVTAQAHADVAKVASVTVNIAPERVLSVAVVPASASLGVGGTQAFSANVTTSCGTFPAGG